MTLIACKHTCVCTEECGHACVCVCMEECVHARVCVCVGVVCETLGHEMKSMATQKNTREGQRKSQDPAMHWHV